MICRCFTAHSLIQLTFRSAADAAAAAAVGAAAAAAAAADSSESQSLFLVHCDVVEAV